MQKHKNIVIVAHKFLPQMDDDLVLFLNQKKHPNALHILHSFSDASDRKSYYRWYKDGTLHKEYSSKDYKSWPEPLIYLKELFFTIKWIAETKVRWDIYLGMDGLCVLFGNILRAFGYVKYTIFWAVDFVPQNRFISKLKHKIYEFINIQGYKRANEMWDLSPRMSEARHRFLNIHPDSYKKHRVVPYGMWIDRIKPCPYDLCEQNTLVFMGHLIPKQGVQLVLEAIPLIVKENPNFRFKVIGDGSFKSALIEKAKELNVDSYCNFVGKIVDSVLMEKEIARSCVAIAPYMKELDLWSYYADPGKVKTYLACGVPILLTDIPWNAQQIAHSRCGVIIGETKESIMQGVLDLMNAQKNAEFRKNALEYAKAFDYQNIFKEIYGELDL